MIQHLGCLGRVVDECCLVFCAIFDIIHLFLLWPEAIRGRDMNGILFVMACTV